MNGKNCVVKMVRFDKVEDELDNMQKKLQELYELDFSVKQLGYCYTHTNKNRRSIDVFFILSEKLEKV